jgi:ATPase family associated with various cellular activities (AAA)
MTGSIVRGMSESLSVTSFAESFRRFLDAVNGGAGPGAFLDRVTAHLGRDARTAPVLSEELAPFEHPTLQRAIDELLAEPRTDHEAVGVAGPNKRFMSQSFSDLLAGHAVAEGPVDWVNVHLAGDEVLPCIQSGLLLVRDGDPGPYAIFVTGPITGRPDSALRVEVIAADRERAEAVLRRLRTAMRRLDVYRGHMLSMSMSLEFSPRGPNAQLTFHPRPRIGRDDLVLPADLLDRVERHTVRFSQHAETLRAAGMSLRRGVLLYGPPGVGKTLTARYLCAMLSDRTILLLTGVSMGSLPAMSRLARQLAPSLVILEDVDLIAEERTMRARGASPSFLFELLNEMDGLRDDADVVFLLTTNRADLLEPALALRPGRVDLAVELPLPDPEGRRRLLALYTKGLDTSGLDLDSYVDGLDGTSPAFIRELLRQAALRAAEDGRGNRLEPSDLDSARTDLAAGGTLSQRLLGGVAPPLHVPLPPPFPQPPAGFSPASR